MSIPIVVEPGEEFGRLVVLEELPKKNYIRKFRCRCTCDKETIVDVILSSLRNGNTTSCGCFHKERIKESNTKHGLRSHPLYPVWYNMKKRCYDKTYDLYKYYGKRGIRICDAWREDNYLGLKNFIDWNDSLPKQKQWRKNLELDRKDNNKNYEPDNCRWVTKKVNQRNRNVTIKAKSPKNGRVLPLADLVENEGILGLTYKSAVYRLVELKWPIERVLSEEVRSN